MLSLHYFIIIIFLLILIIIFYKLNNTDTNDFFNTLENFSNLNKLKNNKKNYSNNTKKNKKKTKYTFDDVITMSETLHPEKYTITNIKNELIKYYNSFNKEKFNNNSKDSAEALDKFKLYKQKFFEIFQ